MKSNEQHKREIEARLRQTQDAAFAAKLRAAIEAGEESCPIGVSQAPASKQVLVSSGHPRADE
jgi:hypothetical protein